MAIPHPKMEYRRLGNSGVKVSVLGFGSWVTFDTQLATLAAIRRGPQRERDGAPALPRHRLAAHLVRLPRRIPQADARCAALPVAMHPDAERPRLALDLPRRRVLRLDADKFPPRAEPVAQPHARRPRHRSPLLRLSIHRPLPNVSHAAIRKARVWIHAPQFLREFGLEINRIPDAGKKLRG